MFKPWEHLKVEHNYSGASWFDFTLDLVSATVNLREFTGLHTATLSFYNPDMDPAESSGTHVVKQGDKVRISANNSSGTSRRMATMRIAKDGIDVAIDLSKPVGRQYLVTLRLVGTGVVGVAGTGAGSGVASASELSNTITGAPFEINGEGDGTGLTAPDGTYDEITDNDAASELDQIALTRDSLPGLYVYEDPTGTLQIFDMATHQTAAATWSLGPENYSQIVMDFDTSRVVNVLILKVKQRVRAGHKGTATAIASTRFTNPDSIAKYGRRRKVVTIHGRADLSDYADAVFDKQADPVPVPTSVTIPIRDASELLGGYEDGTYVTKKVTVEAPDGTTYACRAAKIVHSIGPKLWTVQVFLRHQDEIQPPRTDNSAALLGAPASEVANNPDGSIEKTKLAFDLSEDWTTDRMTADGPGDQTLILNHIPIGDSEELYVGGVRQDESEWTRTGFIVAIPDDDLLLAEDNRIAMHYAYRDPVYSAPTWSARRSGWNSQPTTDRTSLALPTGTQLGDLIVVAAFGDRVCRIADRRLTLVANGGVAADGGDAFLIGVGYASNLAAISCQIGGQNFPYDQFAGLEIIALRGTDDGVAWDPDQVAVSTPAAAADFDTIASSGHGGIVAVVSGVRGGGGIAVDVASNMPGYSDLGGSTATAVAGWFASSSANPPPSKTNPVNNGSTVAVIGLK